MLFINRLLKVANDPIVQGTDPVNFCGVGSHEDCRNRVPCIDEVSVELDSRHRRHVYVDRPDGPTCLVLEIRVLGQSGLDL